MGKCKFANEWLERKDTNGFKISDWGRKLNNDLFCTVCEKTISIEKGFYAIQQHYKTEKHKSNVLLKRGPSQLRLSIENKSDHHPASSRNECAPLRLYSCRDSALTAELIWCLKIVSSNMPIESCSGIVNIFKAMFPIEGSIPENFCLNPTKASYLITDALAPYFREIFISEVQQKYFSLQYDETTNNAGQKELQVLVRYWSDSAGQITTKHLESFYMGHATAEDLKTNLLVAMEKSHLSLRKLLMLASDGPNVNKKVFRCVNEDVKSVREKGLIDIGFCNIHVIHNAFLKGLEELGCDASDFIISIYYYFKDWPSRWEDFTIIQNQKGLPNLHFVKHVSSRWLTMEQAACRVLQQWDAIIEYFLKFLPSKQAKVINTITCKKIVNFLRKRTIKIELMFICSSSSLFTKFTGLFQREEPLIHVIYQQMKDLVLTLMGRICKNEIVKEFNRSPNEDAFKCNNLLNLSDMVFSDEIMSCLSVLTTADKENFLLLARKHYVAAGNYILQKKILEDNSILKSFCCLKPNAAKQDENIQHFVKIANVFPLDLNKEQLIDELRLLQFEDISIHDRIDHYWNEVFKIKINDQFKYPVLTNIVQAALTLFHGSADVERVFSRTARIMTEDRTSMSVRMLHARLSVSDALKQYKNKPELVPITKKLLSYANVAYQSYNTYLEEKRKKLEEEAKKAKEAEELKLENEKLMLQYEKGKKCIEKLTNELKCAKKEEKIQVKVSDKLLDEANKRLRKALDKGDFTEAKLAQTMIEGVVKANEECENKRKVVNSIEKKLEKRRDSVITNFFSKKPRID